MIDLLKFEKELLAKSPVRIAGMDEAGRGPLAGPVAVACCVPDLNKIIDGINDSKKLTEKTRERLFSLIAATSLDYCVVYAENDEIDEVNILNATKRAMKTAVENVAKSADIVLVDAVKEDFVLPSLAIIHGDALSYSIGAASILAKVSRDRLMLEYAEKYPEYGFEKHKGYGTLQHIEALKKYGPCPIHRKSFIKNFFR